MKSNLKCEVVKDLLPLYVDNLTSEVTNNEIEGHLKECKECKGVIDMMKNDVIVTEEVTMEKEIDFLKKLRDKTNKKLRLTVGICALIVATVVVVFSYITNCIGTLDYVENAGIDKIEVNGKKLYVVGDNVMVARTVVEENNGTVTIKVYNATNGFIAQDGYVIDKTFENKIKKVVIEGARDRKITIYEDEMQIETGMNHLLNEKIGALGGTNRTELTYAEDAVWMMLSDEYYRYLLDDIEHDTYFVDEDSDDSGVYYEWAYPYPEDTTKEDEKNMIDTANKATLEYSALLMAVVGDLEEVQWKVELGDKEEKIIYTREEVTKKLGMDVKKCSDSVTDLQKLKNKLVEITNNN